jgi:hypothetical protein
MGDFVGILLSFSQGRSIWSHMMKSDNANAADADKPLSLALYA